MGQPVMSSIRLYPWEFSGLSDEQSRCWAVVVIVGDKSVFDVD
jgi:hypothetical protein